MPVGARHAGVDGQLAEFAKRVGQKGLLGHIPDRVDDLVAEIKAVVGVRRLDGLDGGQAAAGKTLARGGHGMGLARAGECGSIECDVRHIGVTGRHKLDVEGLRVAGRATRNRRLVMEEAESALPKAIDGVLNVGCRYRGCGGVVRYGIGCAVADFQDETAARGIADRDPLHLVAVLPVLQREQFGSISQCHRRHGERSNQDRGGRGELDLELARPGRGDHRRHVERIEFVGDVPRRLENIGVDRNPGDRLAGHAVVKCQPEAATAGHTQVEAEPGVFGWRLPDHCRARLDHCHSHSRPRQPSRDQHHLRQIGAARFGKFNAKRTRAVCGHRDRPIGTERGIQCSGNGHACVFVGRAKLDGRGRKTDTARIGQRQGERAAGGTAQKQALAFVDAAGTRHLHRVAAGK